MDDGELISRLEALRNQVEACLEGLSVLDKTDRQFRCQLVSQHKILDGWLTEIASEVNSRRDISLTLSIESIAKAMISVKAIIALES